jgi:hypothetical protein
MEVKMQTINSKKHKEKILRIIMSDDEQEPEFQVFMQGLKYLQENEDNELVTTIIRSIEKSKATYIPFEDEKEAMGNKHYISFILYEREQRSCAFNYVMLISILNMFNTDVSKTIDQIYNKFQAKCNLMNIKSDILEEQVNELNAFIKEKGLEKEYQMRKK